MATDDNKTSESENASETPLAPAVPQDVAKNLLVFMSRADLKGDEAFPYVRAKVFLKEQLELHQAASKPATQLGAGS